MEPRQLVSYIISRLARNLLFPLLEESSRNRLDRHVADRELPLNVETSDWYPDFLTLNRGADARENIGTQFADLRAFVCLLEPFKNQFE